MKRVPVNKLYRNERVVDPNGTRFVVKDTRLTTIMHKGEMKPAIVVTGRNEEGKDIHRIAAIGETWISEG